MRTSFLRKLMRHHSLAIPAIPELFSLVFSTNSSGISCHRKLRSHGPSSLRMTVVLQGAGKLKKLQGSFCKGAWTLYPPAGHASSAERGRVQEGHEMGEAVVVENRSPAACGHVWSLHDPQMKQ